MTRGLERSRKERLSLLQDDSVISLHLDTELCNARSMRLTCSHLVLTSTLALSACFSASDDGSTGAEGATETGDGDGDPATAGDGDGDSTAGDGDGDSTTAGDGDGDSTESSGDSEAPMLSNFTVAGSAEPFKLLQSQVIEIGIDASDNVGIDQIEFFEDGESIGVGTTGPMTPGRYSVERVISGEAFDGFHTYTAEATDTSGNTATSEAIELEIDVPAAGTMLWERTVTTEDTSGWAEDCIVTPDGRLAVAGYDDVRGLVVFFDGLTGTEQDTWIKEEPDQSWQIDQIEPGADGTGLVVAQTRGLPNRVIEIVRYLDDGTELWNSGPIRESNFWGIVPGGMATTSDLVYVTVTDFGEGAFFHVLDMQSGVEQCSTQVPDTYRLTSLVALDNGDAIIVGSTDSDEFGWVGRYTSECEEVWSVSTLENGYSGLWLTNSGTVLAAGTTENMSVDGAVREITLDGEPGPVYYVDWAQGTDQLKAIAQTPTGITVMGGSTSDAAVFPPINVDLYVRGEQPLGQLAWDNEPVEGAGGMNDGVNALCLDRAGNTYAVGYVVDTSSRDWYIAPFAP